MKPHQRIDIQHHILPKEYVRQIGEDSIAELIVSGVAPKWTPQVSVDAMDRNGIELAVTSLSAPAFHMNDEDRAARLARFCNDFVESEMRTTYKGRFGMFATLPMPHIGATLEEIAYCFDVLRVDGVCLLTNYGEHYLGDPRFAPIFDELTRRRAVIFVHPADTGNKRPLPGIPAATLEFPFNTSRAIVDLLVSGTLARCHDASFIFSHAGGAVPYLADRIARLERRPELGARLQTGVIHELGRLYFDTALSASPRIFTALRQLVPASQILFASDFPFAPEQTMTESVRALTTLGLSDGDLRAIEHSNALALLPTLSRQSTMTT